jgi:DNA-binding MarR family transcriptional regulator
MDFADIQQIRSFNRIAAEAIGLINDRFLGRERPMGESRLLWEVGPDGADLRTLRARLSLDSGYISRLLASLERQGLVAIQAHPSDRRVRHACLTKTGLDERAELERLSDEVAIRVLEPLSAAQRRRLVAAMTEVERLLRPSLVLYAVEDPGSSEAQWCFEQYFAELNKRFESGFDPAMSLSADVRELTAPQGALVLARLHGPSARGLGVGRRLIREAEKHALQAKARVMRLETNQTLREAINLYKQCGYVEVEAFSAESYAHHWFEKELA